MSFSAFLLTSFIIILIPGTGVVYTISTGILKGKRQSIIAALGCTLGIVPHLCVSIVLSDRIMQLSNVVFQIMKYMGVAYLIYMGIGMILSKEKLDFESDIEDSSRKVIFRAILINLLNPKLTLFFFSFLPQYVRGTKSQFLLQSAVLGMVFMVVTFIVFAIYGILADKAKQWFIESEKRVAMLQKIFGMVFIGFAIKLATDSVE